MLFRILTAFWALTLAACATQTAYISSLTDPDYSPTKSDPVFLLVPDSAAIEDRQFAAFLRGEMQAAGFTVTDNAAQSRYILLFQTGQKTSQINSTLFLPQTQTTSGYVGNTYYSGQTTSTAAIPISSNYTVQNIWLELYATSDVAAQKYKTVWEGYIGAGTDEFQTYSKEILRLLLDVYGTNYQAHTPIQPE
ncbi:MAG: hypothetical protein MN733_18775 [Nitrososphaera sp.]|nr:hypothetical protein [Nitrososphaera sp.]